jgi:hypothetical protein
VSIQKTKYVHLNCKEAQKRLRQLTAYCRLQTRWYRSHVATARHVLAAPAWANCTCPSSPNQNVSGGKYLPPECRAHHGYATSILQPEMVHCGRWSSSTRAKFLFNYDLYGTLVHALLCPWPHSLTFRTRICSHGANIHDSWFVIHVLVCPVQILTLHEVSFWQKMTTACNITSRKWIIYYKGEIWQYQLTKQRLWCWRGDNTRRVKLTVTMNGQITHRRIHLGTRDAV